MKAVNAYYRKHKTLDGCPHLSPEQLEKLKADNEEMTKKLNWIRKTKADADAEIKKLTNQVNLLKKELLK